ncbi:hypothetical protein BCR34DRAFT_604235 [Clohesyomyces aquaticus]|uniref:Uncharacterized protein n=1 Tax=Clohesyomyces aquaticus TaxID=1231657 RepID=A0A1Y1Z7Z1_9PLEO|nr:hypothetical protein BCR34DRAFT_604235 [Clohesyomyces aquaticus]
MPGDIAYPWIQSQADTGAFVKALVLGPPGLNLAGEISGIPIEYKQYTVAELEALIPNGGHMLANMFSYFRDFGYFGGDSTVIYPADLVCQYGIEIPTINLETTFCEDLPAFLNEALEVAPSTPVPLSLPSQGPQSVMLILKLQWLDADGVD